MAVFDPSQLIATAPLVTAVVAIVSAVVGSIWAALNIRANRKMARDRGAIDLIFKREWDARYIEHKSRFVELRYRPEGLETWFKPENRHSEEARSVRYVMNDYEMISLAISHNVVDEALYKAWFRGSMIQDFKAALPAIEMIRSAADNPHVYVYWEKLARKWLAEGAP